MTIDSEPLSSMTAGLQSRLDAQRSAFLENGPPSLAARRAALAVLRRLVLENRAAFEAALRQDFGRRSRHETRILELLPLVQTIDYQRRHLPRWMRPERRRVPWTLQPARAWVEYQPLGAVGIVSPWNYPVSLALAPLATALAAGNRIMLKPSEHTPATGALLAERIASHFDPLQVAVVVGDAAVGQAFAGLPFDHLLFTGSTSVGRSVMRAASEHLVPVTLELGGKSPAIVTDPSDLDGAAHTIAYGKLANAGQTCIAPDYALVPAAHVEQFVAAYDRAVRSLYPEGTASDDCTAIIHRRHVDRLQELLDDARQRGATIRPVGVASDGIAPTGVLAPAVVTGVTREMALMREEIFGPWLPIVPYRQMDDAIAWVNAGPRPLALYLFGHDAAIQRHVLARTTSGNVSINATLLHFAVEDLPFGGVGPSGIGAYHGIEGFRTFSHAKGVFRRGRWHPSEWMRPPYGRFADRLLKQLLR